MNDATVCLGQGSYFADNKIEFDGLDAGIKMRRMIKMHAVLEEGAFIICSEVDQDVSGHSGL